MTQTLNLLATDAAPHNAASYPDEMSLPQRVRQTIDGIKALVVEHPTSLVIPYSAGKDSTLVVSLATAALRELQAEGLLSEMISHLVLSADTGVENPLVSNLMRSQHRAIHEYAAAQSLPVITTITRPALSSSFQVSVLGGRRIMPKFGMGSGCSVDWKVGPCQKTVKAHLATLPADTRAVTLLGSRRDEGQKRSSNLNKQGARSNVEVVFHDGQWLAYPIIDFSTEDVFNYLLLAGRNGPFPTFRDDQGDVLRLYSNSSSGCALLATDKTAGGLQTCSARTGCFTCQVNGDEDGSLQSLVETVAPHLQPLVEFRNFLGKLSSLPQCRNYIGTELDSDGRVSMGAKGYAGWVLLAMVRFLLSADADEAERAHRAGEAPAFQVLGIQEIMAIDFWWSVRGLQQRPFEAIRAWRDVHENGLRFILPELDEVPAPLHRISPVQLPKVEGLASASMLTPVHMLHGVTFGWSDRLSVDLEGAINFTVLLADEYVNDLSLPLEGAARLLMSIGVVQPLHRQRHQLDGRLATVEHLRQLGWLNYAHHGSVPCEVAGNESTVAQQDLFTA